MISMDKKYKTRDGREVRIYAIDGNPFMPIHGAIKTESGWVCREWTIDGIYRTDGISGSSCDLIEVPREITVKIFLNVNDENNYVCTPFKESAELCGANFKIVAFPVTVTIPENWRGEK